MVLTSLMELRACLQSLALDPTKRVSLWRFANGDRTQIGREMPADRQLAQPWFDRVMSDKDPSAYYGVSITCDSAPPEWLGLASFEADAPLLVPPPLEPPKERPVPTSQTILRAAAVWYETGHEPGERVRKGNAS